MSKITKEMMEQIKTAKTPEEIREILKDVIPEKKIELDLDLAGKVAGGVGRIQLNDDQADNVVGGGHYVRDVNGAKTWVTLVDDGYVYGSDSYYDIAYILELMLVNGFTQDIVIATAYDLFNVKSLDIPNAIKAGGPVYLADGLRTAHGYHFGGE